MKNFVELSISGTALLALVHLAEYTSYYVEARLSSAETTAKAYARNWKRFGA